MRAREIMRKKVITVKPEMTLRELAQLFLDHHITGAPVVDHKGKLIGVVSQTDLVRHDREATTDEVPAYHQYPEETSRANGFHVEAPDYTRVKDVMTPAVISCEEQAQVRDIARMMLAKRIHRIIVTRKGSLCGIVTSMDLLRALLDSIKNGAAPAEKEYF